MFKSIEDKRTYNREWKQARRDAYFQGKACARCNSTERLELDHINPSQKVDHKIWSWSPEKQEIELAKCQVLCFKCHKNKSSTEKQRSITHGNSGYDRKCRCLICKTAHSERMKSRIR